ncbi:MAG: tetratricopeptide repeat protein [Planctomycetales bacterium]|nr:tetratricopeptide repeat protein [Planctomycetales bacterium]
MKFHFNLFWLSRPRGLTAAIVVAAGLSAGFGGCAKFRGTANKPALPKVGAALPEATTPELPLPSAEAAEVCVLTAESMETGGHWREAAALYERARQSDPAAANYARRLAVLYDRLDQPARAKREYEAALAETPRDADLLNDVGFFYYRQGDLAQAEHWLRRALAEQPRHERAQVNLGMTLAGAGRSAEAFEAFAPVVGPAAAHSNIAAVLARQGRQREAIAACQQALAIDPGLEPSRVMLASLSSDTNPNGARP